VNIVYKKLTRIKCKYY